MKFTVTVRSTSITVEPGQESIELLQPLLNLLEYEDEMTESVVALGYMLDTDKNVLYLHKGTDLKLIHKLLINATFIESQNNDFSNMKFEYDEIVAPRNREQADIIDFISGQNNYSNNIQENQIFLVAEPGFGKGHPVSTKIPTPIAYNDNFNTSSMYTRLGDLNVGDYVFGKNGKPTKILKIFELGKCDVYKVTFSDGRCSLCTDEHLWTVSENGLSYKTMKLCDIRKTYLCKKSKTKYRYRIPICDPVMYEHRYCNQQNLINDIKMKSRNIYNMKLLPEYLNNDCITRYSVLNEVLKYYSIDEIKSKNKILYGQIMQLEYSLGSLLNYEPLYITDVSYMRQEDCRCIMVDNANHLYLTEDFIVTHNTYCSSVAACKLGYKTLIIVHRDQLRKQWLGALYNMVGLSEHDVHEISSSEEIEAIVYNKIQYNYDVYIMTHSTFRAGLKRLNTISDMENFTKNLHIGLKIIDEAHLEFRDTLTIDFLCNVGRNLYLTATAGRSNKDEDSIFRRVFSNADFYKKPSTYELSSTPPKWVDYIRIELNSHCPPNTYRYRVVGNRGMSAITYGKWVISTDKNKTHFKVCRDILRDIYEKDSDAKVMIFMPLIDLCDELAYFCKMQLNYDKTFDFDLNIKTINSHNSKSENECNKRADVIITTIASCGTGTDIKGITDIICCSPFISKITATQVFGRLRYCGKLCHYYDIWDSSVQMDKIWMKSRAKKLCNLALNSNQMLTWVENDNECNNQDN